LGQARTHHTTGFSKIATGVVRPLEGDVVAVEGQQAMIADGDAMGVKFS
jgi:hypothetical protein